MVARCLESINAVVVLFSSRKSSIKLLISKVIQIVMSMKETLPASDKLHITNVVDTFLDVLTNEDILDGIVAAIDVLRSVVLSVADSYKQAAGNVQQADLMFNLLTECLEGLSQLRERVFEGKDTFISLHNVILII